LKLFRHYGRKRESVCPRSSRRGNAAHAQFSTRDRDGGFDPLGSYTGTAQDGGEPEQDADDL